MRQHTFSRRDGERGETCFSTSTTTAPLLLLLLRANCKNVCAWSLHEFAFTLGYGITLKIAKFFAFGCLVHKARCHVPAVR